METKKILKTSLFSILLIPYISFANFQQAELMNIQYNKEVSQELGYIGRDFKNNNILFSYNNDFINCESIQVINQNTKINLLGTLFIDTCHSNNNLVNNLNSFKSKYKEKVPFGLLNELEPLNIDPNNKTLINLQKNTGAFGFLNNGRILFKVNNDIISCNHYKLSNRYFTTKEISKLGINKNYSFEQINFSTCHSITENKENENILLNQLSSYKDSLSIKMEEIKNKKGKEILDKENNTFINRIKALFNYE